MASSAGDDELSLTLPTEAKRAIEQAAALAGQSVSEFAVSTLLSTAEMLVAGWNRTVLTKRDREAFIALLNDADAGPNEALAAAALRYKKRLE
jgi:uncharacterized protein (DUF1778 family)